jgi:heat shock protein HslJ
MDRIPKEVSGDSISGFSGCNNYSATYRSTRAGGSSNNISIGPISSGQAMCDETIMNEEQAYFANLESASDYTIGGDTLTLNTGGGGLNFGAAQATQ